MTDDLEHSEREKLTKVVEFFLERSVHTAQQLFIFKRGRKPTEEESKEMTIAALVALDDHVHAFLADRGDVEEDVLKHIAALGAHAFSSLNAKPLH